MTILPQREGTQFVVEPLRIEYPYQEDPHVRAIWQTRRTMAPIAPSTPPVGYEDAHLFPEIVATISSIKIWTRRNQASAPAPAPAPVKAVELSCVTCGGAHSHQNCPATHGNVYRDNISEYVSQAAAANQTSNASFRLKWFQSIRPPSFHPFQNSQANNANNFNRWENNFTKQGDVSNFNKHEVGILKPVRNFSSEFKLHRPQSTLLLNPREDLRVSLPEAVFAIKDLQSSYVFFSSEANTRGDKGPSAPFSVLKSTAPVPTSVGVRKNPPSRKGAKVPQASSRLELSDIQRLSTGICTHKILLEDDYDQRPQHQRRGNPKIHDVIKKRLKILRSWIVLPILPTVPGLAPIHCVPKRREVMTVVVNEENELILTRLVTDGRIDLRKLNLDCSKTGDLPFELMCDASDFTLGCQGEIAPDGFSSSKIYDFKVIDTKGDENLAA
ncbi:hypothetical protein Tco_0791917 [Tanacetum coccineum]